MPRFILSIVFALASLFALASAQAGDIKGTMDIRGSSIGGGGLQPLSPKGMLTIGGITGGNKADPGSRNCYGSTRCKESGSYYSEQGVMQYKNGDPVVKRKRTRPVSGADGNTENINANNNNHTYWCSNQYRSYRASDNSYQPFTGGRQSCNSPY